MGSRAQDFRHQEITEHLIPATCIDQTFRIRVWQPMRRADGSERFPVLYATDADDLFPALAVIASVLQTLGEIPRFILVGIGYDEPQAAAALRMRDLWTHGIRRFFQTEIEQLIRSPLVAGVGGLERITQTTDAGEFLRFIRDELMPFVAARYPVLDDNSYFGYSAGGTFGLYTMFTQPGLFKRYIIGSPGTSYDGHHFALELARDFARSHQALSARAFMSVGELEEFKHGHTQFELTTGYYQLAKFLKGSPIEGLDLAVRVFPDETHATAWMPAFSHGLRRLFGPAEDVPYWPEFLKSRR